MPAAGMREGGRYSIWFLLCWLCLSTSSFLESTTQNPTAELHFRKGKELQKKNKTEEALREFNAAIELDPYFVEAHRKKMDIQLQQKKGDEVRTYYKQLLQSCPDRAACHYLFARSQENDSEALKHYLIARDLDPQFVWAYVALAYWNRKEGQFEQALEYCKKGQTLDPSNSLLIDHCAYSYDRLGKNTEAISEYTRLLDDEEFGLSALLTLGDIYFNQNQYLKAKQFYEKAAKDDKDNSNLHHRLGDIYSAEKKHDKAVEEWEKAVKLDSKNSYAMKQLGYHYKNTRKDLQKAVKWYLSAAEANPGDSWTVSALAGAYRDLNEPDKALRYLEQLQKLDPLNPDVYVDRGIIYEMQKKYALAIPQFQTAYDLTHEPYPHLWNLAIMYDKRGEDAKALQIYRLLQKSIPDHPKKSQAAENVQVIQNLLSSIRIHIDKIYAEPQDVRPSQSLRLVMVFSVSGSQGNTLFLTEKRRVMFGNENVGSPILDYATMGDGQFRTAALLKVPQNARPGNYVFSGRLNICGVTDEKVAAFRVR